MKLLWLTENHPPDRGGMSQSSDRIVRGLRGEGVEIDVVHLSGRARRLRVDRQQSGRLLAVPLEEDPAHTFNQLSNFLGGPSFDGNWTHLVAFGGFLPLLGGPVLAAWKRLPLVVLLRGNDFDTAIFSTRRRELLKEALTRAAVVCSVTSDHREKVEALFPGLKVVTIPNGIDLNEWALSPSDLASARKWREEAAVGERRVLALFGELKAKKGALFFLETLLKSGRAGRAHLLLVGELAPAIREWLEKNAGTVKWTAVPFLDRFELLPYFAAADAVVIPSLYDGMPNVLLEAAALARPVLASTAGGMRDVLIDGRSGILFHPADLHSCRRAIETFFTMSSDELQRIGIAAQKTVQSNFNRQLESARYLAALSAVADQFKEAPCVVSFPSA